MRFKSFTDARRMKYCEKSTRLAMQALRWTGLASAVTLLITANNGHETTTEEGHMRSYTGVFPRRYIVSRLDNDTKSPTLLAPSMNQEEPPSSTSDAQQRNSGPPNPITTIEYDFVVLGSGNAGLSAVLTLRETCPSAKIALVDPLRPVASTTQKLDYWPHRAVRFDPVSRTVQLSDKKAHQLLYRHGILVATGSRGAPPPPSLLDERTLDRVFEIRPTTSIENKERPVVPPHTVRQLTLMAASRGATVGVMGSGWEAVELAVAAASAGSKSPVMMFGSAGPLSHILPRYLTVAVTRRLEQQGVDVQRRSLVRYVATDPKDDSRLEVHTAKSYDMLDTKRTSVDLLVVAPYVDGPRGTAILPTVNTPQHLQSFINGQPWFQSWSQLTSSPSDPSIVVCFDDDGRIMVNAELQAASGVYAAGSAAKYPSSVTGHAHVAGEGRADGARAGRRAALHMARNFHERNSGRMPVSGDGESTPFSFAAESFPLVRSDMCSYLQGDAAKTTALWQVGITALCVGQCDSDKMSTHGFWWTNLASKRQTVDRADAHGHATKRPTRRRQTRLNSQKGPVYGIGIVYYLDRTGRIRGIMTWGLPFTSKGKDSEDLNEALLDRMKEVIGTNGGISQWEAEENAFLHSYHLSQETKKLACLALAKGLSRRDTSSGIQRLMVPAEDMGRPLHRYTAAKPSNVTGLQMKRKDKNAGNGDAPGENLFVKDGDDQFGSLRPPTLMYVYPMHNSSPQASLRNSSPFHNGRDEKTQLAIHENELRARPPREEPLWLRRGEARKSISHADAMSDMFIRNMRQGKFADGSYGLQQAPVPKWMRSDNGSADADDHDDINDSSADDE